MSLPDIFVINLDRDKERYDFMRSQLSDLDLPHQRVPAVFGRDLPSSVIQAHHQDGFEKLTHGEIGCLHSHIKALTAFLKGDNHIALILEDDVHISKNLNQALTHLSKTAPAGSIIKIEASHMKFRVSRSHLSASPPYSVHGLTSHHFGTAAYLVTREAADVLVTIAQDRPIPFDYIIFDPVFSNSLYQLLPSPCIQDQYLKTGSLTFGSVIGDRLTAAPKRSSVRAFLSPLAQFVRNLVPGPTMHVGARFH